MVGDVAGRADLVPGVLGAVLLREAGRTGDVRLVAAHTEHGGVGLHGLLGRGVPGMRGERTVAGLAVDALVSATLGGCRGVVVALEAGRAAGVHQWPGAVVVESARAVMAVEAEALRDQERLQDHEHHDAGQEQSRDAYQVLPVSEEPTHRHPRPAAGPESAQEPRSGCIVRKIRRHAKKRTAHGGRIKLTTGALARSLRPAGLYPGGGLP